MIRPFVLFRPLSALVAVVVSLAAPSPAQDGGSSPIVERSFGGGEDGAPGFRIRFDARGAGVRSVELLDHRTNRLRDTDPDGPYRIVDEELADPADPTKGYYGWLLLAGDPAATIPQLAGIEGGLDLAAWRIVEDAPNRLRFAIDGADGLTVEKLFAYDGEGRRDLRIELVLRSAAGADVRNVGAPFRFALGGIALAAPRSDYVLGQNPAMAVGSTIAPDGAKTLVHEHANPSTDQSGVVLARGGGGTFEFAGNTNRFFGAFLYPADEATARGTLLATMTKAPLVFQLDTPAWSVPVARYVAEVPVPAAGQESRLTYRLYLGPKSFRVFDERPAEYERFDPVLEQALDPMCFCSIPGSRQMAIFLLWLLGTLHGFVGNWGIAIVLLTILVRGSLVPLNFRMQKSMRAYGARMAVLKPKLDALQAKYANDPQQLRLKMVEFQRENKMIPPIGGCLPMFVTIPVFLGLFTALRVSYDLRQQPFFGWLDDLSRPDHLFELGFGFLPWFNILPLVMVVMWLWLQSNTPLPSDPQQRQMMKVMRFMPLVFGVMLYNYASGLMVYMITSSAFALLEQRITKKILGPMDPNAAGLGATPMI